MELPASVLVAVFCRVQEGSLFYRLLIFCPAAYLASLAVLLMT
jgi:hypothetical protein